MRPGARLTLVDLKGLHPGDRVYLYYSESGDSSPGRLDGVFKVDQVDSEMLVLKDEDGLEEFPWRDWDNECRVFDDGNGGIAEISWMLP